MVSSLLPFCTAIGGGALLDCTTTQLFGTSVLRRVRQAAECPTTGARREKESNKGLSIQLGLLAEGFPCTGESPFLSTGRTCAAAKESCRLLSGLLSPWCSAPRWEMVLQGSGKPPFPSQAAPQRGHAVLSFQAEMPGASCSQGAAGQPHTAGTAQGPDAMHQKEAMVANQTSTPRHLPLCCGF